MNGLVPVAQFNQFEHLDKPAVQPRHKDATPAAGQWLPTEVAKALPNPPLFAAVWVVGFSMLQDEDYIYGVTLLDPTQKNAPAFLLRINKDFAAWEVMQIQ